MVESARSRVRFKVWSSVMTRLAGLPCGGLEVPACTPPHPRGMVKPGWRPERTSSASSLVRPPSLVCLGHRMWTVSSRRLALGGDTSQALVVVVCLLAGSADRMPFGDLGRRMHGRHAGEASAVPNGKHRQAMASGANAPSRRNACKSPRDHKAGPPHKQESKPHCQDSRFGGRRC
jgi:hypothetical protein